MPDPIDESAILPTTRLEFYDQKQRTSFSGADFLVLGYRAKAMNDLGRVVRNKEGAVASDAFVEFANIQTLSVSTTRDIAAERVLGTSWAKEYSRGARSVAGTLAFTMFDGDSFAKLDGVREGTTWEDLRWYSPDDIPEFNIVLTATNEYGHTISGILLGVVITNTGTTVGVQDVYTEQIASYVARRWMPFKGTLDLKGSLDHVLQNNPQLGDLVAQNLVAKSWLAPALVPIDEESKRWAERKKREAIDKGDPLKPQEALESLGQVFE